MNGKSGGHLGKSTGLTLYAQQLECVSRPPPKIRKGIDRHVRKHLQIGVRSMKP